MTSLFDHKAFLKTLTVEPGIYKMLNKANTVLYVGKAKNLKNRVSSYFQKTNNARLTLLVEQIDNIDVIVTKTENEALLLENTLIKRLKPRYNILFRDDKSYPYIFLSAHSDYPRLDFHRGSKSKKGRYFGPFPSSNAVRKSLNLLQKLFKIRQCSDIFFRNRTRPCIQYQIKRCSAPCVEFITPERYQQSVQMAQLFLEGKNRELIDSMITKMQQASHNLAFEEAALYRDQIQNLRQIQQNQSVIGTGGDIDIMAVAIEENIVCVQILFVRGARLIGNHNFFTKSPIAHDFGEILSEFIPQFYLNPKHQRDIPKEIFVNAPLQDGQWLEEALSQSRQSKVTIVRPRRGDRKRLLDMALQNANTALKTHMAGKMSVMNRFQSLKQQLHLDNLPQRIECFDISHTMGDATVASCVVFNQEGPHKESYRRFNIKGIVKGDDYAAMRQVLERHYSRLKKEERELPDIILIDGGKGQMRQAEEVLEELQISSVIMLGIVKGEGRRPELDRIFKSGVMDPVKFDIGSAGFHLLQQIRDEAHRFAITGHRRQRQKQSRQSSLENISGVGEKRRQKIIDYFGGLQGVLGASVEQLSHVPGISQALAVKIYSALR